MDISSDLIQTSFGLRSSTESTSLSSVSRLAQSISIFIPEAYIGENLTRAEILYRGSAQERLQELLKGLIVQFSNNHIKYDVIPNYLPLFNQLLQNGFHLSHTWASQHATILSLVDNLFRRALEW